jgi:uncharacterized membrane protein (UPF0127 family)
MIFLRKAGWPARNLRLVSDLKMKPALIISLSLYLLLQTLPATPDSGNQPLFYQVRAADRIFIVEVATSPSQRQLGLMHRESLRENGGLLMVFNREHKVSIWMKNVLIPLDVVWISSTGEVVDSRSLPVCQANPCSIYQPEQPARYVLEVAAGQFPLKIGDKVEIIDASGDSLLPPESGIIPPQVKF